LISGYWVENPELINGAIIEDIEFDRDIVVFVDPDLPSKVRCEFRK